MQIKFAPLKQQYKYNFFEHGVTKSMIDLFLQCPVQCYHSYVLGLQPQKMPEKFIYGNTIHYALETYYRNQQRIIDLQPVCDSYFDKYVFTDEMSVDEIELHTQTLDSAKATVNAYLAYYFNKDSFQWPTGVEEVFKFPLKFHPKLPPVNLNGMMDLRFPYSHIIADHKTKSRIDMEKDITKYPIDTQLNLYALVYLLQYGTAPKFIYNIFRVPQDRPKKNFYEHLFNKMIEKPDYYFHREVYETTEQELLMWQKKFLNPLLERMYIWWKGDYKYPGYYNPVALDTMYGLSEWFRPIVYQDYTGYTCKKYPFMELLKDE